MVNGKRERKKIKEKERETKEQSDMKRMEKIKTREILDRDGRKWGRGAKG